MKCYDTGKLATLPDSLTRESIAQTILNVLGWMEAKGMDLFRDSRTEFFGVGMLAIAQDEGAWERLTAVNVQKVLNASTTKPSVYVPLKSSDGGATYVFQTREGGSGVLEILGSSDGGVKIRYKLLRQRPSATRPATSESTQ